MSYQEALIITRQFQANFSRVVNGVAYRHTEDEKRSYAEACEALKR